jgi:hypothetical protein
MASSALKIIEEASPQLSLELPKDQPFEDWLGVGRELSGASKVLNWWIGDWWAAGSHRYGERAKVAAQGIFGREFGTLANLASVCRAFETSRRREHLSFSHHAEVASLAPAKADVLLDRAEREGWSKLDLRAEALLARERPTPRWFEAKPAVRFDRDAAKEAVFKRLNSAAELGEICPTADELQEVAGVESVSTTVALMHVLEREGRIEVTRYQKSRKVVIVATGQATAEPANQTPHWREKPRDVPIPAPARVTERSPAIAKQIFIAAKRKGLSPQDYLVDLVLLGWEVECCCNDSLSRGEE